MITQQTQYYVWQQHQRFTWSNIFSDSGCSFQDISFSHFGTRPCESQFTQEYPDNRGGRIESDCIQMIRILSRLLTLRISSLMQPIKPHFHSCKFIVIRSPYSSKIISRVEWASSKSASISFSIGEGNMPDWNFQ